MKTEDNQPPALFISKTGATMAGLSLLARLPNSIDAFEVSKQVRWRDQVGYNLKVFWRDPGREPVLLSEENHKRLMDKSKGKTK